MSLNLKPTDFWIAQFSKDLFFSWHFFSGGSVECFGSHYQSQSSCCGDPCSHCSGDRNLCSDYNRCRSHAHSGPRSGHSVSHTGVIIISYVLLPIATTILTTSCWLFVTVVLLRNSEKWTQNSHVCVWSFYNSDIVCVHVTTSHAASVKYSSFCVFDTEIQKSGSLKYAIHRQNQTESSEISHLFKWSKYIYAKGRKCKYLKHSHV